MHAPVLVCGTNTRVWNEYTSFHSLSLKKVLRKIEEHEAKGWEFVLMQPRLGIILGGGGWFGQTVVMRRRLQTPPF